MSFGMWEASVPLFVNSLTNMRGWLDKAAQKKDAPALMEARLAPSAKSCHAHPRPSWQSQSYGAGSRKRWPRSNEPAA
jgi:hypothetical protein